MHFQGFFIAIHYYYEIKIVYTMGLSAWGAGKRIENHQRDRISFFSKLKKRYRQNLEEIYNPFKNKIITSSTYYEIEELENKKRKRRQILQYIRDIISLAFLIFVFWLLYFYLFQGD